MDYLGATRQDPSRQAQEVAMRHLKGKCLVIKNAIKLSEKS